MLTKGDKTQIEAQGMPPKVIQQQLNRLRTGYPQLNIVAAATLENGILQITEKEKNKYRKLYNKKRKKNKILKFVPASGAASRMFGNIYEILEAYDGSEEKYLELLTDRSTNSIYSLCENISDFAFYPELKNICDEKGESIDSKFTKKDYIGVLEYIVSEKGLNYGNLPKGLIKFHNYKNEARTALEEHLVEGAMYAASQKQVNIHFTVSPEHLGSFRQHITEAIPKYEKRFNLKYNIEFSTQKKFTDTIAATLENQPVKNKNNEIIFRPGGHGSLIENLKDIDADLIFIKNIDNIVTDRLKTITVEYKELLGGFLFELSDKIDSNISKLKCDKKLKESSINKIVNFCQKHLYIDVPKNFNNLEKNKKIKFLLEKLDRPIRVCGMVRNEDELGGGPFWIEKNNEKTLQIIERAQFDLSDKKQLEIFKNATHFNPVDIACKTKDFEGKPYDLSKFVDIETGLISKKSYKGKTIKAIEHPGLWNGAMANWITIFIEVPMKTFNPVKTIHDLLREEHRF